MDRPIAASPAAALGVLGRGRDREAVGPLAGEPVVVVALAGGDDERADLAELAELARRLPCVTVGVGRPSGGPPPDLDVLLTDVADPPAPWVPCPGGAQAAAAGVATAVRRSPDAAVVLVQLLRLGDRLGAGDALVAESLAYGLLQTGPVYRDWLASRPPRRPPAGAGPPVVLERRGGVLDVTLDRPAVRNAYDTTMRDALVEALELVLADDTITAVHLRGAGPSFCSGGFLDEFGTTPSPVAGHLVRSTRSAQALLLACADRVVAHVHGPCVGAGVELAAFAGRVEAAPGATFRLPEVAFGLVPGAGGTVGVRRRIGRQRTAWLALTGTALAAPDAVRWGLVDAVGP